MGTDERAAAQRTTTRPNGKRKAIPIMGTSAMNTLRMEFATLQHKAGLRRAAP